MTHDFEADITSLRGALAEEPFPGKAAHPYYIYIIYMYNIISEPTQRLTRTLARTLARTRTRTWAQVAMSRMGTPDSTDTVVAYKSDKLGASREPFTEPSPEP